MIFVLLLSLVGTAALFLPFTSGVSPWYAVTNDKFLGGTFLLGAPFFLSILILIWQARRLIVDRVTTGEIVLAYLLATAAMLPIARLLGMATIDLATIDHSVREPEGMALFIAVWLLLLANMLQLLRNLRPTLSREAATEAFLLGAYLPNAVFCLIAFYPRRFFSGWQIGAYLVATVSLGYLAAIVLLSRQKPTGTPVAVEVPT
jgi:hypothetical protein